MPNGKTIKVLYYLNQFFAGIGGEDKANYPLKVSDDILGPAVAFNEQLGERGRVLATIICGDNYLSENQDKVASEIEAVINKFRPDVLVAGPAFNSGRYGLNCGFVCSLSEKLGIPAATGMYRENPAVELYRHCYIIPTRENAAGMKEALPVLAELAYKLGTGEKLKPANEEGYLPRNFRENTFVETIGAKRAVNMLLSKVNGSDYETEIPLPNYEKVDPAPALMKANEALIALVSTGGIVLQGNPDRFETARCSKWVKYPIGNLDGLNSGQFESIHGGYENRFANQDPNRVAPLDAMRELEGSGHIGRVYEYFYAANGAMASLSRGKQFGSEIAGDLMKAGVNAVILTST